MKDYRMSEWVSEWGGEIKEKDTSYREGKRRGERQLKVREILTG